MSGGGGTNTTVQSNAPPAQFLDAYSNAVRRAQDVSDTPYQRYPGETVAQLAPDQLFAMNLIRNSQGIAAPYINSAAGYIDAGTTPLWSGAPQLDASMMSGLAPAGINYLNQAGGPAVTNAADRGAAGITAAAGGFNPGRISEFMSPYIGNVVDATQAQFNNQNAIANQGVISNAISRGAWGGDRSAVAQGIMAGQQQLAQAPVIAGLYNTGYQNATNAALAGTGLGLQGATSAGQLGLSGATAQGGLQSDAARQMLALFGGQQAAQLRAQEAERGLNLQGAGMMSGLGQTALGTTLTGANALLGTGGLQQAQAQANLNVPYQQFIEQKAYPFQTAGWLANIAQGLGGGAGGTSTSAAPGPSVASQVGGGIVAATGLAGLAGKAYNSWGGASDWGSGASSASDVTGSLGGMYAGGGEIPRFAYGGKADDTGVPNPGIGGASGLNNFGIPMDAAGGGGPEVSFSVVPEGASPAPGRAKILKDYGQTATTESTGGDGGGILGDIIQLAATIVGAYYGGSAGGSAAGTAVGLIRKGIAAGGEIAPSNDNSWSDPERQRRVAGGPVWTTVNPSVHGGPGVPYLNFPGMEGAPGTGIGPVFNPSYSGGGDAQAYLAQMNAGRSFEAPAPSPTTIRDSYSAAGLLPDPDPSYFAPPVDPYYASIMASLNPNLGVGSGGAARGGSIERRDVGGSLSDEDDFGGGDPNGGDPLPTAGTGIWDAAPPSRPMGPARLSRAEIFQRAMGLGYSPAGAQGITDNFIRESGGKPGILGDNGASFGLGQWQKDRRTALEQFAAAKGTPAHSPDVQFLFMDKELREQYPRLYRDLRTTNNPAQAEDQFRRIYERPASTLPGAGGISDAYTFGITRDVGDQPGGIAPSESRPEQTGGDPWKTLMNVGLGIMSGTSPHFGVNVGQGAIQGLALTDKEQQTAEAGALRRETAKSTNMYRQAQLALQRAQLGQSGDLRRDQLEISRARLAADREDRQEARRIREDALVPSDARSAEWWAKATPDQQAAYKAAQAARHPISENGLLSDETKEQIAERLIAGDQGAVAGLGYGNAGATNRAAVQEMVTKKLKEKGLGGADLAASTASYMGERAGARAGGTREANVSMAVNEAKLFMPVALAASDKVSRTEFPTLNTIIQAYEKGTGDENIVRLAVATNSLTNAYSRAITPSGIPTEGNQTRARELLDKAWSKGQYRAAVDQLWIEMEAAQKSPIQTREEQRARISGRPGESAPISAPGKPARYQARLPTGAILDSDDGKAWFTEDGKPYNP
jgi:hypothetical protein